MLENNPWQLLDLVDSWIYQIADRFDLILITEEMDTSLAVLMVKFCWTVNDVAHFKLNANLQAHYEISTDAKKNLNRLNWADFRLYNFFKTRLRNEVDKIGREKIEILKLKIVKRSQELTKD